MQTERDSIVIKRLKEEGWIQPYKNTDNKVKYWTHPTFPTILLDTERNYGSLTILIVKGDDRQRGIIQVKKEKEDLEIKEEFTLSKVDIFLANSIIEVVFQHSL